MTARLPMDDDARSRQATRLATDHEARLWQAKVLVVEDDPGILRTVADNLRFEQYEVLTATDGETAYALHQKEQPDLIVLDLMLPRMSGLDLCRKLRTEDVQTPVLMLTARGEEADRIRGLDLGGDDYVTKPFSVLELMARVRALLRRRVTNPGEPATLTFGQAEVDFERYAARCHGRPVDMTRKEFALLRFLASRKNTVVTRDEILNKGLGPRGLSRHQDRGQPHRQPSRQAGDGG